MFYYVTARQFIEECFMRIRTLYPDNWILIIDNHSIQSHLPLRILRLFLEKASG